MKLIRIGTRTSNLAMWQANKVKEKLENSGFKTEIVGISSSGDKSLGGDLSSSVGQFIHAVDNELISNNIDLAVHSSKDVPVEISPLLSNLAYLERGCTSDLLIFPKKEGHMKLEKLFNSEKQTYQLETFKKYYPNLSEETITTAIMQSHYIAAQAFVLLLGFFIGMGSVEYFVFSSLLDMDIGFFYVVSLFTITWLGMFIIPGAPGGIGIREFIVIALLSPIYGPDDPTIGILIFRVITVLGDAILLPIGTIFVPEEVSEAKEI